MILEIIRETAQNAESKHKNTNDYLPAKRYLLSVDEKTGIQALERVTMTAPANKGGHTRQEFEYKRNGTTTLMAAFNVGEGKIQHYLLNPTRTEVDFGQFIEQSAQSILTPQPDAEIIFMADQLNTHLSETLVIWVAKINQIDIDLGKKGKSGILKDQKSRKLFLEDTTHPIRFVFTPKHCSWLNPVENWFAKLQRHVIENGNFESVEQLNSKIEKYITFYNLTLFKPIKWKFKGFLKKQQDFNFFTVT